MIKKQFNDTAADAHAALREVMDKRYYAKHYEGQEAYPDTLPYVWLVRRKDPEKGLNAAVVYLRPEYGPMPADFEEGFTRHFAD